MKDIDSDELDAIDIKISNITEHGKASLKFNYVMNFPEGAETWNSTNKGASYFDFRF